MKDFCIVIPVYKRDIDPIEEISIKRMWALLKDTDYDIFIVAPNGLNIADYYNAVYPDSVKMSKHITELRLDTKYFESTAAYSQLCLSYDFYKLFENYEYMYIFQLDVYLNIDRLKYWCTLGVDYIGAPILSTDCGWPTIKIINGQQKFIPAVGNGGFSLRKISTFMDITDPNGEYRTHYNLTEDILKNVIYEDLYFCVYVKEKYTFEIAPLAAALAFAWDMSVDILYNLWNIKTLPMAIHAWDKNIRLWKNLLPELKDNNKVIDYCEQKHKEFFKIYYDENNSSAR